MFENKVLRKIFWAKRDEITGEWRKLHNAELHALYSSPNIFRNLKSRRLRWLLLDFTTFFNILGHQCHFRHRA